FTTAWLPVVMIGTSPATAAWTAVVPPSMNTSSTSSPCLRNRPASWATHSGADWPPTVNQATFRATSGRADSDGAVVALPAAAAGPTTGALAAGAVAGVAGAQASSAPRMSTSGRPATTTRREG